MPQITSEVRPAALAMCSDRSDTVASLLVDWPCDLCGSTSLRTLRKAQYSGDEPLAELLAAYNSSSESPLKDQLSQCRSCGLVFVSPRLPGDLVVQGYAEAVDSRHFAQATYREASFERAFAGVLGPHRWIRRGAGSTLLDVGCAGGSFLAVARAHGFTVAGVEPSVWLAEQGSAHYGLDITAGVFNAGDYGSGSFDIVSLWDVLEHVPSPTHLLQGIHEVMKPGGALVVNVPTIDSVTARVMRRRWPFYLNVHLYYFTLATLTRYLGATGFTLMGHCSYWQTLPMGYVAERALGGRLDPARIPRAVSRVPIRYNLGQRTFVARRT